MTTVVIIGRNEGDRLVAGLDALVQQGVDIVYVDSGSSDGSVERARQVGALVVELDMSVPFTAARARQAGVEALRAKGNLPDFIQFIDGDCALVAGWIDAAEAALREDPELGLVTGWRVELYPERSLYNAMCEFEWHGPVGDIVFCGGDMMVRRTAYEAIGGFDTGLIASEDHDICIRLAKAGWSLRRLPLQMTRHDADMMHFSQWWRRAVRSGHGFAQIGWMHPPYFRREQLRALFYGLLLPLLMIAGVFCSGYLVLGVLALFGMSYVRTTKGLVDAGLTGWEARRHARLLTLSKFPNIIGMAMYHWRRLMGHKMHLIEYK